MLGLGRVLLEDKGMEVKTASRNLLLDDNLTQWEEAQGPVNRWYAGESLGHEPSKLEAFLHYVKNGGAKDFRQKRQAV